MFAAVYPRRRGATVAEVLQGDAWVRHVWGRVIAQLLTKLSALLDQ